MKYYGNYLVGKQSDWVSFANEMGFDINNLISKARRSTYQVPVINEYLWLVEVWDLSFSDEYWCWKSGLYPLRQFQAQQLGTPFLNIRDKNNERILDDNGSIVSGKEKGAIEWCRTIIPNMEYNLTQTQALQYIVTNNIQNKLKFLFDAFENEPLDII